MKRCSRDFRCERHPSVKDLRTTLSNLAGASASLTNLQVSGLWRSIRPLEPLPGGKQVERPHPNNKSAGQDPLPAGSRIATHSTWCVIGKMSA